MSAPSDHLRDVYERRGELEYATPPRPDPIDLKFTRIVAALAAQLPCEAFLDAGCGDGRHIAALPDLGQVPARVVGLDIADSILRTALAAAVAAGVKADFVRANIEALPFPDCTFDLVLCAHAIEHVLEPSLALQELRRVMRVGAVLLISTDSDNNRVSRALNLPRRTAVRLLGLSGRRQKVHFPHRQFGRQEFESLLQDAGFTIRRSETFRFFWIGAPRVVLHVLNRLDSALTPHSVGDILLVEAVA